MVISSVRKASFAAFAVFLVMAFLFTVFRMNIAAAANYLLVSCNESKLVKYEPDPIVKKTPPPPVKIAGAQAMPQSIPPFVIEKDWNKKRPVSYLSIQPPPSPAKGSRYVAKWAFLGPFKIKKPDNEFPAEKAIDFECIPSETSLDVTLDAPEKTSWKEAFSTLATGKLDFRNLYRGVVVDYSILYGVTELVAAENIEGALLYVYPDDQLRIWLNGVQVYSYNGKIRPFKADLDKVSVNLKKGSNTLMIKSVNFTGDWSAYIRLADASDKPLFTHRNPPVNAVPAN